MNKLDKFLAKIDKRLRAVLKDVIILIISDRTETLHIKKLKGNRNWYRVRVGRVRIIFEQTATGNKILSISYRDDNTY